MKKMNNNNGLSRAIALLLAVVVALGISIMPDFNTKQTSAATKKHNGKEVAGSVYDFLTPNSNGVASKNKKLIKKLKKNAWSENANPASEMITQGYALYKIYDVFVDSGFLDTVEFEENTLTATTLKKIGYSKIIASSKNQKKAINWMLTHWVYEGSDIEKGVFDGKRNIKRIELIDMLQGLIRVYFPMSLEDIDTGTSWLIAEGFTSRNTLHVPMMKGIVTGEFLDLDDYATKEDLSRALKNLKLVIKYRIQPVYRDKAAVNTESLMNSQMDELIAFFKDEYDASITVTSGNIARIHLAGIYGGYIYIVKNGNKYEWGFSFGFNYDVQEATSWYVYGEKIDIVETIKQIFKIRYWK